MASAGALPLQSKIDQASAASTDLRVIEVNYGNGYAQRARDGLNASQSSWRVEWNLLGSSDLTTLVSSISSAGGADYFTWQPPGDSTTRKWVIKTYSHSPVAGDLYRFSASLEQDFSL